MFFLFIGFEFFVLNFAAKIQLFSNLKTFSHEMKQKL